MTRPWDGEKHLFFLPSPPRYQVEQSRRHHDENSHLDILMRSSSLACLAPWPSWLLFGGLGSALSGASWSFPPPRADLALEETLGMCLRCVPVGLSWHGAQESVLQRIRCQKNVLQQDGKKVALVGKPRTTIRNSCDYRPK